MNLIFGKLLGKRRFTLLLACATTAIMIAYDMDKMPTSFTLVPKVKLLLFYLLFFVFGYMICTFRHMLFEKSYKCKPCLIIAVVLSFAYFYCFTHGADFHPVLAKTLQCVLYSLVAWLMTFGLIYLFMDVFNKPSARFALLSKASYWIYLVQAPVILFLNNSFRNSTALPLVKFLLIVNIVFFVLLLSYIYIVEKSIIGNFLLGKAGRASKKDAALVGQPEVAPVWQKKLH
jgi:peptidoglycan/LPS O-acetylase OafA/YrhL